VDVRIGGDSTQVIFAKLDSISTSMRTNSNYQLVLNELNEEIRKEKFSTEIVRKYLKVVDSLKSEFSYFTRDTLAFANINQQPFIEFVRNYARSRDIEPTEERHLFDGYDLHVTLTAKGITKKYSVHSPEIGYPLLDSLREESYGLYKKMKGLEFKKF
jgi:cupin superfamily acireductone dioxygenase involved in methionine salvage